jgi:hypothetical protein
MPVQPSDGCYRVVLDVLFGAYRIAKIVPAEAAQAIKSGHADFAKPIEQPEHRLPGAENNERSASRAKTDNRTEANTGYAGEKVASAATAGVADRSPAFHE